METKNKLVVKLNHFKHIRRTKLRRKYQLKFNYLNGLEYETAKNADSYLTNELARIERYFIEDTQVIQKRLDGVHKHHEIKEYKLKRYDHKMYWKRRRFKTIHKNAEDLNVKLDHYDKTMENERLTYIEKLNDRYHENEYSEVDIHTFKSAYQTFEKKKEVSIKKIHTKYQNLISKNSRFLENLIKTKEKYNTKIKQLATQIEMYNASHLSIDKSTIEHLNEQLKNEKLSEKKNERLTEHRNSLINKVHLTENEDIHLSVEGLKMYFGGIKAVNDLSFDVKKGEIFGLIGPNGAGKTTVFNCITQFYKPTGGSIYFRNKEENIVDLSKYQTHDMIHEGIARSFQNVELIWELTVLDNLLVAGHSLLITDYLEHMVHTRKMKREENVLRTKGYQLLKELGIESYAFRSPYGLPYGVLKKIELARTLMTNPSLIILDEPAAGLNDAETIDLAQVIKEINQKYNVTIFLVEHDMGLVMSICERVCAISFGKKLALDNPKGIQSNLDVRIAYLGDDSDE